MNGPIVAKCLRQAGQLLVAKRDIRDAERSLAAMAKSQRVLAERHTALGVERDALRDALFGLLADIRLDTEHGAAIASQAALDAARDALHDWPLPVVEAPRTAP